MSAAGPTDGELLAKYAATRDEASFELVLRRHSSLVLNACRRVLGNTEDAEDAAQAVFLVLNRKAGELAGVASVAPWLMRVSHQAALNAAKSRSARRRHEQRAPVMQPQAALPDSPEKQEFQRLLDAELDSLPEKYRRVLVLHHMAGHTEAETAKIIGSPEGTVCTWLARGRERLRERLGRRGMIVSTGMLALLLSAEAEAAATSASFVSTTLGAVRLAAAGKPAAGAALSPHAVQLSEGVLKTMFYSKLKTACVVLLAVSMIGSITGMSAYRAWAAEGATTVAAVPESKPAADKDAKAEPFDVERAKKADFVARGVVDTVSNEVEHMEATSRGSMRVTSWFKKDGIKAPEIVNVAWGKGEFPLKRACTIYVVKVKGEYRLLDNNVEQGVSHIAPAPKEPAPAAESKPTSPTTPADPNRARPNNNNGANVPPNANGGPNVMPRNPNAMPNANGGPNMPPNNDPNGTSGPNQR